MRFFAGQELNVTGGMHGFRTWSSRRSFVLLMERVARKRQGAVSTVSRSVKLVTPEDEGAMWEITSRIPEDVPVMLKKEPRRFDGHRWNRKTRENDTDFRCEQKRE